jgi:TIR domain-containing protein
VRCWFAPEDLKWGERIRTGIDEAIRLYDKLLLILSKSSVASGRVEREVKMALAKERKEKRTVLFPVRVDRADLRVPLHGQQRYAVNAISATSPAGKNTTNINNPSPDCFTISRRHSCDGCLIGDVRKHYRFVAQSLE